MLNLQIIAWKAHCHIKSLGTVATYYWKRLGKFLTETSIWAILQLSKSWRKHTGKTHLVGKCCRTSNYTVYFTSIISCLSNQHHIISYCWWEVSTVHMNKSAFFQSCTVIFVAASETHRLLKRRLLSTFYNLQWQCLHQFKRVQYNNVFSIPSCDKLWETNTWK